MAKVGIRSLRRRWSWSVMSRRNRNRIAGGGDVPPVVVDPDAELKKWIGTAKSADYHARKMLLVNGGRGFQESTGNTPVTASADKIGLSLDGAQWGGKTLAELVAGQPNVVFPLPLNFQAAPWNASASTTVTSANQFTVAAASTGGMQLFSGLIIGKFYSVEVAYSKSTTVGIVLNNNPTANITPVAPQQTDLAGTILARFQAVSTGMYLRCSNAADVTISKFVLNEIPGFHGLNATGSQRLNMLIAGDRYTMTGDGTDDNLLTTWLAASGGNTIFFDADVPATISASQAIIGAQEVSPLNRFRVAIETDGRLSFGLGLKTADKGTTDWRGKRLVGAVTHDGSIAKIFTLEGGEELSIAQSGSPTTTIPVRLAASNNNGTAGSYFAGGFARIVPVQKGGLTLADWQKIGPEFAKAA